MNQADPNFDWITARAKCSPTDVLLQLESQTEEDIKKRNELSTDSEKKYGVRFHFQRDLNQFSVWTLRDSERLGYASFQAAPEGIRVIYIDPQPELIGTLTLSNDGECKLRVNDDEYTFWQFRKLALEPLLFTLTKNLR
jgi:hypothetical protein